ncbi:hypothetical protein [Bradyrhizobium sp. USDA 3315]
MNPEDHIVLVRRLLQAVFVFLSVSSGTSSAVALDKEGQAGENWRPKDGIYGARACAGLGRDEDEEVIVIELAKKSIAAFEQQCTITRLTDAAPGSIRLNVACTDVLTDNPFPETFILENIDTRKIFVRETNENKFTRPGLQMTYCPDKDQNRYLNSQRKPE